MANASPLSPTNQHFFQPLLPGFQSNLKIPVNYFSEHIEGKHEGKTVTLRTDASERTWEVKMEGHRLTEGWKEFVEAHDLRIGDFVVFRHEGDMVFHVTALGPSCCEIQYPQSSRHEEGEESGENEISEKEGEENVQKESDKSSSDLNCFSQSVTHSNISRDAVSVPRDFVKRSGFSKGRHEIVLMNEEGKSWESEAKTPVFQLCSRTKVESMNITGESKFVKLTPTPSSLELGKQHLPLSFTKVNGLINPGKIILVDKDRAEWSMMLKVDSRGAVYIIGGNDWKSFCAANEVGAGESLALELIQGGVLLNQITTCFQMEQPSFKAEDGRHKRARVQNRSQETDKGAETSRASTMGPKLEITEKGEPSRASTMRPKVEIREKIAETGEPSRASNKSSGIEGNLQHTKPCSVKTDQLAKVKESVVDTLTSIGRFQAELETMKRKLEDSLQELN
ncbi:B3 DNA binding domain [Arabidopsis suecica]|uniref:B3 DNA binding domain n=1 Tax=Arabidopsis suecica TaxID=45249 RepID=A0A8T2EE88_ARASU|nr:B3 DNA binding domain [Arabidopsis suecica]